MRPLPPCTADEGTSLLQLLCRSNSAKRRLFAAGGGRLLAAPGQQQQQLAAAGVAMGVLLLMALVSCLVPQDEASSGSLRRERYLLQPSGVPALGAAAAAAPAAWQQQQQQQQQMPHEQQQQTPHEQLWNVSMLLTAGGLQRVQLESPLQQAFLRALMSAASAAAGSKVVAAAAHLAQPLAADPTAESSTGSADATYNDSGGMVSASLLLPHQAARRLAAALAADPLLLQLALPNAVGGGAGLELLASQVVCRGEWFTGMCPQHARAGHRFLNCASTHHI